MLFRSFSTCLVYEIGARELLAAGVVSDSMDVQVLPIPKYRVPTSRGKGHDYRSESSIPNNKNNNLLAGSSETQIGARFVYVRASRIHDSRSHRRRPFGR